MSALGSLVVSLNANIAKFESAMNRANYLMNKNMGSMAGAVKGLQTSIDSLPGSLLRVATSAVAIGGISMLFKRGIEAVDDFRVSVIGIAASLTDMSKPGQGDMAEVFGRNEVHATKMYRIITLEAARHFATANEGMMVYTKLVQSGYSVREKEVPALMLLTDKIKLATKGQDSQRQLNTEIMALMEGQARAGSLIALELKTRLGPSWNEIVQKQRNAGTLLEWMATLYPGLEIANKAIENTLNAQWATTKSLLGILSIDGLGGAYDDIVQLVKQINKYLIDHGAELAGSIATGWERIKELVGGVWGFVKEISNLANQGIVIPITVTLGGAAKWLAGGAGPGGDFGFGAMIPGQEQSLGFKIQENQRLANEAAKYKRETYRKYLEDLGPSATKPGKGVAEKGTKAAEAEANRLMQIYDALNKDIARLSEGSMSEVTANLEKTINQIYKKIEHTVVTEAELEVMARQRAALQKQKIEEEFNVFIGKESGNNYLEIEAQAKAWLTKYKGIAGAEVEIAIIKNRKIWEEDVKQYTEKLSIQESLINELTETLPLLSQQLPLKRLSLQLEIENKRYILEAKMAKLQMTEAQKDEIRGLEALIAAQKRYNLEMENNKGLSGWAWSRAKEVDQRNSIKDMMTGLESGFQNAFSSGLQGVLSKDKNTLKDIGRTMLQGFVGDLSKGGITRIFDSLSKIMSPQKSGTTGVGGLTDAGQILSSAGLQLTASAGGLLLSGIGIMANSQALVYAGTVLQLAGLAIQLYQGLTATTQITAAAALTGSAAALSAAASALMMAAAVEAIPFFHQGGVVRAHSGWPRLRSDEIPIIAQTGERVLSRSQNRDYEAGQGGGAIVHIQMSNNFNTELTLAQCKKSAKNLVEAIKRETRNRLNG